MSSHPHLGMPPDPFAGDPDDPSAELGEYDPEDAPPVLDADERRMVEEDLHDVQVFERLLTPMGIRGIQMDCEDCQETHYHDWAMLSSGLRELLEGRAMSPHEPAFDPDPHDYATWDYCAGYADAAENFAPRKLPWRR